MDTALSCCPQVATSLEIFNAFVLYFSMRAGSFLGFGWHGYFWYTQDVMSCMDFGVFEKVGGLALV